MDKISLQQIAEDMNLQNITPDIDLNQVMIGHPDINRPALQLAGFFEHFDRNRIQIVGNVEMAYLSTLTPERRARVFRELFSRKIPCLVFCRNHQPEDVVLQLAEEYHTPLLATNCFTSDVYAKILRYLQEKLAPVQIIHGVLVDVFGEGVLIIGESGIGKSEVALELIKRGHRLVADDAVELHRVNDVRIIGRAPAVTKHLIELRGIGIIDVKALYGVESIKDEQDVDMVIRLEEWDKSHNRDRLGGPQEYVRYLGNRIICYSVPVRPGRNVAVIVEAASVNFRQKKMGYDATEELMRRVEANMRGELV